MLDKGTILFVGLDKLFSGMRACDSRLESIANIFMSNQWNVVILNRGSNQKVSHSSKYLSAVNVNRIPINFFYEFNYLRIHSKKIKFLSLYSSHCIDILYYYILGKVFKKRLIYHYVEYRSSFNHKSIYQKLNGWLFDNYFYKLADGFITISKLINKKVLKLDKPTIKIPPLIDEASLFEYNKTPEKYFAYCGSIDYVSEIRLIISAFLKLETDYKLILVLGGDLKKIEDFKLEIQFEKIKVLSKISREKLYSIYSNSRALLLPLKDNIQNNVRFPQKIAEYSRFGGYIITNKVGDLSDYFKHDVNIIFCDFTEESFYVALKKSLEDKNYTLIRKASHENYLNYFNTQPYMFPIEAFLNKMEV